MAFVPASATEAFFDQRSFLWQPELKRRL